MTDKIILASSSPRRVELLKNAHINFETVKHGFDEDSVEITNPVKLVKTLARSKAESIAVKSEFYDKYVLGVDTIVVYKNKVLGKPGSKDEAESFIRMLSGKTHRVLSGISIINKNKSIEITRHSVSFVKFSKINTDFIKYYLDNNLFKGYAGGYAIQGIFSLMAEKIKGSYSNIVGLPVDVLYKMLNHINFKNVW